MDAGIYMGAAFVFLCIFFAPAFVLITETVKAVATVV